MRVARASWQLAASSKGILVAETVAVVTVSVLVTQFATQIFTDMMSEEGAVGLATATQPASGSSSAAAAQQSAEAEQLPYDIVGMVPPEQGGGGSKPDGR